MDDVGVRVLHELLGQRTHGPIRARVAFFDRDVED